MELAEKTCTDCGATKSIDQFSLARNGQASRRPVRKSKCKPCMSERAKQWFRENPERTAATKRRHNLAKNYNMTVEQYDQLFDMQDGKCAVCGSRVFGRLPVDHCHRTGRVRGLLCHRCNRALGLIGDSVELLRKAIDYLERT